jgi:hypothetical protein
MDNDGQGRLLAGTTVNLAADFWDRRFAGRPAQIEQRFPDGSYLVFVRLAGVAARAGFRLVVSESELARSDE